MCSESGYRGRTAIGEVLLFSKEMRRAVEANAGEAELWEIALRSGMTTLQGSGSEKAYCRETTAD